MDRLLARLERSIGKIAIPHLAWVIVGGMAIVAVLTLTRKEILGELMLDVDAVKRGQVWRLITYSFIPRPSSNAIFAFIQIYFVFFIASNLENAWGSFKFNVYYFVGLILTTATTVAVDLFFLPGFGLFANAELLHLSLLLAVATLAPDTPILLLVIPVKLKWIALLTLGLMIYSCVDKGPFAWAVFGAAMGNYLLFFGGHLIAIARGQAVQAKQAARRVSASTSVRPPPAVPVEGTIGHRACAICGAKETDGTDIRVCNCAKCNGVPRALCLEHARNH